MVDLFIRDIPDDVVAAIDANARRNGLSRTEYVRRTLARETAATGTPVTVEDLSRVADAFRDLGDPDVMQQAWE